MEPKNNKYWKNNNIYIEKFSKLNIKKYKNYF